METGKPGLANAPVHFSSVAAQTAKRMDVQAPLRAVYIHTVPAAPAQPYPPPTAAAREPAALHLAMPPLYSSETLPFLTLHIAGGLQSQPGLSMPAAAPAARPKSAGKHVCPHCGRDCMKPSVLEKHLRCHTGERPYPCTTCGVSFKTQSNLYKHKRTQAHARLSSESEQSSLGSLDSTSVDESSMEKDATSPGSVCLAHPIKTCSVMTRGSTGDRDELTPAGQKTESNEGAKETVEEGEQRAESDEPPLTVTRHLPLQRQEATLFSKQWESSGSSGKSQSRESTDSGFSESSDHYPSPASALPDHSMDSLTESSKEHPEEAAVTRTPSGPGQGGQECKDPARENEQKTLEERISKLISENTAVVEDKQLDHVRPRKTVLSKQGSIDLPMPYTYKDSFHFDMKIGKTLNVGLQRSRAPGLHSSVPTQHSGSVEHAPLTRSSSLPFSVERSRSTSSHQRDPTRRGSSGHISATSLTIKPVTQQPSSHRPLVRQTAVDCIHAADGTNSSAEEAQAGGLGCDICAEPSGRKLRRKKTQKFAYNKWYMYGGGTFKKLYSAEQGGDYAVIKGRRCANAEHELIQGPQKKEIHKETVTTNFPANVTGNSAELRRPGCPPAKPPLVLGENFDVIAGRPLKAPLRRNLSLSVLPSPSAGSPASLRTSSTSSSETGGFVTEGKHSGAQVPSDRKKQKTDDKVIFPLTTETRHVPCVAGSVPQQEPSVSYTSFPENHRLRDALFLPRIMDANVPSVGSSPPPSVSSAAKTSFLPKYQLKLPHGSETDSSGSSHAVDKPSGTGSSARPSPHTEQTAVLAGEHIGRAAVTPRSTQTNAFSLAQAQIHLPCAAKTSQFYENGTSSIPVVHRQFAATTITTTCRKNYQTGICSTSIQPSKSAAASAQSPTRAAPQGPTSAGVFPPGRPASNPHAPPTAPCHLLPQNVYHVHTADLQICLQIISDEQLALIEPQIERQGSGSEVIQSKAHNSATAHPQPGHHKETSQSASLPTTHAASTKSVHSGKVQPNMHMSHSSRTPLSAESKPPEAPGLTLRPHKHSNVSIATQTLCSVGDAVSTAASLIDVKSGRHQTSDGEHDFSLNCSVGDQIVLDKSVSSGQLVSETLSSKQNLSVTCVSPGIVNQSSTKREPLGKDGQEKAESPTEAKSKKPARDGAQPCLLVRFGQASCATCANELSGPVSAHPLHKCKCSSEPNDDPSEPTLTPSKCAHGGCDGVTGAVQELPPADSQDPVSSAHSEEQLGRFTSACANMQVERPKDIPAVPASIQSPAAGVMEAASLVACAGQQELRAWGQRGAPGQPGSTDPRLGPSRGAGETNHPSAEEQGGGRPTREEEEDGGTETDQGEDLKFQAESFRKSRLSQQHLSQTHSGMSENPQQALGTSHNIHGPPGCRRSSPSNLPQPTLDTSNAYFSQQQWESSIAHNQQTQMPSQTPEQRNASCCARITPGSLWPDVNTSSTKPAEVIRALTSDWAGDTQTPHDDLDAKAWPPNADAAQSSGPGSNKYQPFLLTGPFQCPSGGVRPVPSCQDCPDDTSSSDEEGKLIIEL